MGAIFGPAASNTITAGGVATDILTGEADDSTLRSLRFITPTGNLPYLDPIWDNIMAADRKWCELIKYLLTVMVLAWLS